MMILKSMHHVLPCIVRTQGGVQALRGNSVRGKSREIRATKAINDTHNLDQTKIISFFVFISFFNAYKGLIF
jgi:hypothetical protein